MSAKIVRTSSPPNFSNQFLTWEHKWFAITTLSNPLMISFGGWWRTTRLCLQIQRELVDEHKDIANTAAGEAVNQELNDQIRRHQVELKGVQEEMEQALKEEDEQLRRELEEERRKVEEQMEKIKKDSEGMALNYAAEKDRMEARMKEIEQGASEERERADGDYRRQSTDLDRHPQDSANITAADRPRLEQEMERPQDQSGGSDDNGLVTVPIYK